MTKLQLQAEEHFGKRTPFDSVYKLEELQRRAQGKAALLKWLVNFVVDQCLCQITPASEMSVAALAGRKKSGGKGCKCQSSECCNGEAGLCFSSCLVFYSKRLRWFLIICFRHSSCSCNRLTLLHMLSHQLPTSLLYIGCWTCLSTREPFWIISLTSVYPSLLWQMR